MHRNVRPKKIPLGQLIKLIEEIYAFRYSKENHLTNKHNYNNFPDWLWDNYSKKYKTKILLAQHCLDLLLSLE